MCSLVAPIGAWWTFGLECGGSGSKAHANVITCNVGATKRRPPWRQCRKAILIERFGPTITWWTFGWSWPPEPEDRRQIMDLCGVTIPTGSEGEKTRRASLPLVGAGRAVVIATSVSLPSFPYGLHPALLTHEGRSAAVGAALAA